MGISKDKLIRYENHIIRGSGGGSAKNGSDGNISYGGGAIIVNIFNQLMVNGHVKADGSSG